MEVIIIGAGTCIPHLKRAHPCLAVNMANETLVFDMGPGSLRRLVEAGIDYLGVNFLYFTHLHPDHTLELASFLVVANDSRLLRKKDLYIIGPVGIKKMYKGFLKIYKDVIKPKAYKIRFVETEEGKGKFEGWKIETKRTYHTRDSIGYRVESNDGRVLVYSGDAIYCKEVVELSEGADLLILECSFPDELGVKSHLTPATAGRIAQEAGCKRLVLTHRYPVCDEYDILGECKKAFAGEVIIAEDFMKIEV